MRVDYKSVPAVLTDLAAGRVQMVRLSAGSVMPMARSGKIKALAVTSAEPSVLAPGLPTIAASAPLPGYHTELQLGLYAPANTPAAVVNRLNEETVRYLKTPEAKDKFLSAGLEVVGSSAGDFSAENKAQVAQWSKVIKDAGIKGQ